jgi:hypothetical protein
MSLADCKNTDSFAVYRACLQKQKVKKSPRKWVAVGNINDLYIDICIRVYQKLDAIIESPLKLF